MGQSSGQDTSTTRQDPWSGQQPYLQDIFSQANQTYNSGVGSQYFPGSTVVPFSPDTEAGMGQIRNTANQPVQGLAQANNVTNRAMMGGQPNALGVLGQAAGGGMQNSVIGQLQGPSAGMGQIAGASNTATPFIQQMLGASGLTNSYAASLGSTGSTTEGVGSINSGMGANSYGGQIANQGQIQNTSGQNLTNQSTGQNAGIGAIQQASNQRIQAGNPALEASANGSMLNANPYMDQMYNTAARQVADNANAQFSAGGRYGSGAHTDVLSRNLGDMAGQMYGQNYANERQNQLSSANSLNQYQAQDIANQMSGASQVAGLNESQFGRQANAGAQLFNQNETNIQRGLGALQSSAGLQESQFGRQLSGGQALAGIQQNDFSRAAAGQQAQAAMEESRLARQANAYGQAASFGAADLSRQMAGGQAMAGIDQSRLGMLGSLQESGINRQLDAANQYNQYGLNQTAQGLQAASSLPALRQYGMSGAQDLMGLGQMQEGQAQQQLQDQMNRWNFQQQSPWDQLGRYSGLIGGMGNLGGTQTSSTPTTSNPYMGALGGAATGFSVGGPWGAAAGGLLGYMGSR